MPLHLEDDRAADQHLARVRFSTSPPRTVATHDARRAAGLHHWVDGTMGIVRRGDRTVVVAPNGRAIARHDLRGGLPGSWAGNGLITALESSDQVLRRPVERMDHASGGPVLVDPESGRWALVYHGERFSSGDPTTYWSFLGMAVSDDEGRTFTDLGPVLSSHLAEHDPDRTRNVEVGPGAFAVRDGWFHLYFLDRSDRDQSIGLGVARASVADLWTALRAGRPPTLAKWHDGAFAEPGLGGRASDLLPGPHARVIWFDVAVLEPVGLTLLLHATITEVAGGVAKWTHVARVSPDGIAFSRPVALYDQATADELIYLTIDSGGPNQRIITDEGFDLYRTASTTPFRWDDARLEHVRVSWSTVTG